MPLPRRSQRHDALVLGRDAQIAKRQARQISPMRLAAVTGQTPREGGEDVVLAAADQGRAIVLVPHVAQFVDALRRRGGLRASFGRHGAEEAGDVLHRGRRCGRRRRIVGVGIGRHLRGRGRPFLRRTCSVAVVED